MQVTCSLQPGDGVDVRVFRWNRPDPLVSERISFDEAWIPGGVHRIDDDTVTIFIYESHEYRVYPVDSTNWRPAL